MEETKFYKIINILNRVFIFDTNERIANAWACEVWIETPVSRSFL